jgi:ATP-dependent Clp protease protease subunit
MSNIDDFRKYARGNHGISSLTLHRYNRAWSSYISPTIIEERQLNVASMDVFSRLMMDRIIFLRPGKRYTDIFQYPRRICKCRPWDL